MPDNDLEIPHEELEQQFCIKQIVKNEIVAKKSDKIEILKPERRRNIEIILGKLKLKNNQICDSLLSFNEAVLNDQVTQSLI